MSLHPPSHLQCPFPSIFTPFLYPLYPFLTLTAERRAGRQKSDMHNEERKGLAVQDGINIKSGILIFLLSYFVFRFLC